MSRGLLVVAIGGGLVYGLTRKKKRKRKTRTALSEEILDSGIGYAEKLGINVHWAISRIGGEYVWAWEARDPFAADELDVSRAASSSGFSDEEEAAAALGEVLGLKPLPKPPVAPEGDPRPDRPTPMPGSHQVSGISLGVPLASVEIYPRSGDKSKLPRLHSNDGMVVSPDCTVAGVGPLFWETVGDRVERIVGEGVIDETEILQTLAKEHLPVNDIRLCHGAALIFNEMTVRVRSYLEG